VGLELTGRAYDRLVLTVDNSRDAVASFDSAAARTASITATQAANSSAATARIQMADRQSVAGREPLGQRPFKDPGRVDPAHVPGLIAADQPHAQGIGTPRPHHHHRGIAVGSGRQGMGAEHGMRVVVAPTDQAIEVRLARVPGQPGRADLRGSPASPSSPARTWAAPIPRVHPGAPGQFTRERWPRSKRPRNRPIRNRLA
jgi:hypothetical protein